MSDKEKKAKINHPEVITPDHLGITISSAEMASQINHVLSQVYGRHHLSPSAQKTQAQIESGELLPFTRTDQAGNVLACAALIDHGHQVEIGRAANNPESGGSGGGQLMLDAITWLRAKGDQRPIVAETRMSGDFEGIPGGQGSQHTLINKAGMKLHALMPAFHHPGSIGIDRQELFGFLSLDQQRDVTKLPDKVFFPKSLFNSALGIAMIRLAVEWLDPFVGLEPVPVVDTALENNLMWQHNGVFHELVAGGELDLNQAVSIFENQVDRFGLASLDNTPLGAAVGHQLLEKGFTFLGFSQDREDPKALWGKLNPSVTLAPIGCASSLPGWMQFAAQQVDTSLRRNQ